MADIKMFDEIRDILLNYAEVGAEEINTETDIIEELGLDSFSFISMLGEVEETFDISISEEEMEEAFHLFTPADIIKFVAKKAA
ncbi:acyl carrier protein [Lachnospiraceae bacterium]|nr:acyl carrier protein [Lachnospiraceae bacterium]